MNAKAKSTPSEGVAGVHTSAQPETIPSALPTASDCTGCGGCGSGCKSKPAHHKPTPLTGRDQYTGVSGRFVRDPATGERKPAHN